MPETQRGNRRNGSGSGCRISHIWNQDGTARSASAADAADGLAWAALGLAVLVLPAGVTRLDLPARGADSDVAAEDIRPMAVTTRYGRCRNPPGAATVGSWTGPPRRPELGGCAHIGPKWRHEPEADWGQNMSELFGGAGPQVSCPRKPGSKPPSGPGVAGGVPGGDLNTLADLARGL
jgi:hypothetical protein